MKHYYIVQKDKMLPFHGEHHYIDVNEHRVVVLGEELVAPTTWEPLPHLLDPTTVISDAHVAILKQNPAIDCSKPHTAFTLAVALGKIHPLMRP